MRMVQQHVVFHLYRQNIPMYVFTVENLRRRWFTLEKLTKSIMNTIAGNYEDTFPAILPFARYICKNSK